MTLPEALAGVSLLITVLSMFGGALYMRGKLDGFASDLGRRLDALERQAQSDEEIGVKAAEARGAQTVRNEALISLTDEMRDVRDRMVKVESGLERHEEECVRRHERIEERFTSHDARFEHLNSLVVKVYRRMAGEDGVMMLPASPKATG